MSEPEPDEPPPPPPSVAKVQIVVAGHEVMIEAAADVTTLAAAALNLFEKTTLAATRIPIGYSIPAAADLTLAAPPDDQDDEVIG